MADEAPEKAEEGEKKPKPKKDGGKNPLVAVLLLVNAVALGFVAFMQMQVHERESARPSVRDVVRAEMESKIAAGEEEPENLASTKKPLEGILLPLDNFTANLAQVDGPRRFVRLNAVLKFSKNSKEEEFKARKPQIRDTIINILNSKRPKDLLKREGKEFLKQEIKAAINAFLIDGQVTDVYYVGFSIN